MPHFVLPCSPQVGPLINVIVGVSHPRGVFLLSQNQPVPPVQQLRGLLDTGASHTSVDPAVIVPLGLSPRRRAQIITPSTGATPHVALTYDVAVYIPTNDPALTWQAPAMEVSTLPLRNQGLDMLIGRDILSQTLLIYDGRTGTFTLSF